MELPPLGLYTFNVTSPTEWKLFPWRETASTILNEMKIFNEIFKISVSVENCLQPKWLYNDLETTVRTYEHMLFFNYDLCMNYYSTRNTCLLKIIGSIAKICKGPFTYNFPRFG